MKLLLDACAFLWLATAPGRLSQPAADAIDDEASERLLSDESRWEISLKHFVGKLPLPDQPRQWIPQQCAFFEIATLNIDSEAIYRSGELPDVHRDPFDRLLAAQAITEAIRIVSPDELFDDLGAERIW